MAAGVARLLAIKDDEFPGRRRAAHLGLKSEHGAFDGERIDFGVEPAEGRLAGRGAASGFRVFADAQGAALALAQTSGKRGEIFLPARRVRQMGAGDDG